MQTYYFQFGIADETFQIQPLPVATTPELCMAAFNELRDIDLPISGKQ